MLRHGSAGDGAHAASIGAVEREEGFARQAFSKAEKARVFGHRAAAGENAKAERVFKTFLHLLRWDGWRRVCGPVKIHKVAQKPF